MLFFHLCKERRGGSLAPGVAKSAILGGAAVNVNFAFFSRKNISSGRGISVESIREGWSQVVAWQRLNLRWKVCAALIV